MKCIYCHGDMKLVITDFMCERPVGYTLIKGIPLDKCTQCGEIYFDQGASEAMDAAVRVRDSATEFITIPVLNAADFMEVKKRDSSQ